MGLGKLGLPCALAIESKGHSVLGYDIDPNIEQIINSKQIKFLEDGVEDYLEETNIEMVSLEKMVAHADIIFVPIQTPHNPLYEGTTKLPDTRVDFDYSWLKTGINNLAKVIEAQGEDKVIIIISTVLPGTIEREIQPLLNEYMKLCYNPFFIAMGTAIQDFLHPEFVLFGVDDEYAASKAEEFYATIHNRPFFKTSIKSAELIKVAYNTYIGMKIVFANTMMEICHHTGACVDDLSNAMGLANERIMSTKYLFGGMGDGGGCHPRDNIAMSWLSNKLNLSHNFFDNLMMAREHQTEWLGDLMESYVVEGNIDLPMVILGKSFKAETNIITGSPSILLKNILEGRGHEVIMYDPYIDEEMPKFNDGQIFLIGTKHLDFIDLKYPMNSVIIDPWRYIEDRENIEVIRIGDGF